jgi:hypothetical protein
MQLQSLQGGQGEDAWRDEACGRVRRESTVKEKAKKSRSVSHNITFDIGQA